VYTSLYEQTPKIISHFSKKERYMEFCQNSLGFYHITELDLAERFIALRPTFIQKRKQEQIASTPSNLNTIFQK
jgi:hypothetical protein